MSRKRRKKSTKCPEPFNTLTNIAGGIIMGLVANRMEKKYHYSKKGKVNPYTVSAMGLASGLINSTEDLLKTGAVLGAMGSFDVEADDISSAQRYKPLDPVFSQIREAKVNNNRYAWRLNCADGSAYGISPYDHETKEEYNEALKIAMGNKAPEVAEKSAVTTDTEPPASDKKYFFVRVSRLDNGANQSYLSENLDLKIGDTVSVPTEKGPVDGIVIAISQCSEDEAPQPLEDTWKLM